MEKQEVTSGLLESKKREQSDIKSVQNGEGQMENQFFKEEKTEENVNTSKKSRKELMEDKASEKELEKNQESNTLICSAEIKICGKNEGKQQKLEQNKEDCEQIIKDKKQFEENNRKDSNSGVSRNKGIENETNTHQKLKGVIQTAYRTSKASKESSGEDEGSTDEVYQRTEEGANRQGERKYYNYGQNETKVTERLRTRSVRKEMNKSGDQLPTAQNSSNLEKKTNETRNVLRDTCPICDKYVKAGVQCGYCQRWFHFKCKNTTEEQVLKNSQQNNNIYARKTNIKHLKILCSFSIRRRQKK